MSVCVISQIWQNKASFFVAAIITGVLLLFAYNGTFDNIGQGGQRLPVPVPEELTSDTINVREEASRDQCSAEQHHVAFIKVHKAGSSTVANILFRFGMNRNLTFLLPRDGVTINLGQLERWKNIMPLPKGKPNYDILSNHAVYGKNEIKRLFPRDTSIIAILRKPLGQLESAVYYYYKNKIPGQDKVAEYLKNPAVLPGGRMLNNSMAYELGVPREHFRDVEFIKSHLWNLVHEIDLVLILERLDESLVLLKRRFCWRLQDIVYITRNVNSKKPHLTRTENEFKIHRELSPADYMLHEFFTKRLENQIGLESEDFSGEVTMYKKILIKISEYCFKKDSFRRPLQVAETRWNEKFYIFQKDCKIMQFSGKKILEYAKTYQYGALQ